MGTTWKLPVSLIAVSVNLYFSITGSKTLSTPGFNSGWHFSCHANWFGPNGGCSGQPTPAEKHHRHPQLESPHGRLDSVTHHYNRLNVCCCGWENVSCWMQRWSDPLKLNKSYWAVLSLNLPKWACHVFDIGDFSKKGKLKRIFKILL